jgi:hypothetical protein
VVVVTVAEAGSAALAATRANEEETASVNSRETLSHFDVLRANDGSLGYPNAMKHYASCFGLRSISYTIPTIRTEPVCH